MVAALGNDVAMNCAAARAGLVRSGVLENYRIRSAVEGSEQPVIGHAAHLYTKGFEGETRLVRLMQGALLDLLRQTPHVDWPSVGARFYVALPDPARGQALAPEGSPNDTRRHPWAVAARILEKVLRLVAWPGAGQPAYVSVAGHAAGPLMLQAAMQDLANGATQMAVVIGVDSLLDEDTLNWLHSIDRLKCDGAPDGLQPGEACVALALTRAGLASQLAKITAVAVADEPRHLLSGTPTRGEALAQVVTEAWRVCGANKPWIVSDQNGEVYRAMDWGHAVVRLRADFDAFADPELWYPAASFGDTGAVSALLGICMAAKAWQRNYAVADAALIVSSADGPSRAAIALHSG